MYITYPKPRGFLRHSLCSIRHEVRAEGVIKGCLISPDMSDPTYLSLKTMQAAVITERASRARSRAGCLSTVKFPSPASSVFPDVSFLILAENDFGKPSSASGFPVSVTMTEYPTGRPGGRLQRGTQMPHQRAKVQHLHLGGAAEKCCCRDFYFH